MLGAMSLWINTGGSSLFPELIRVAFPSRTFVGCDSTTFMGKAEQALQTLMNLETSGRLFAMARGFRMTPDDTYTLPF